jgi:hypothetical protein
VSGGQVWGPAIVLLVAIGSALHYRTVDERITPAVDEGARFLCDRLENAHLRWTPLHYRLPRPNNALQGMRGVACFRAADKSCVPAPRP